ncbi:MAG: type II toxin-antitoxin system VapC family toxin [Thermoplasmatota archaeon]
MIVLDTDILIDHARGVKEATTRIRAFLDREETLATTTINVMEFLRGEPPTRTAATIFDSLRVLPFDMESARRAGSILAALDRAGKPIGELDACVAAISLEHGAALATRNNDEFRRVPTLQLA